jgi:hypothetical protein
MTSIDIDELGLPPLDIDELVREAFRPQRDPKERRCPDCGIKFVPEPKVGRPPKFCPDCRADGSAAVAKRAAAREYQRERRTTSERPRCVYENCGRTEHARGLCLSHYGQWWHGRPLSPIPYAPARIVRFV